MRSPRIVSLLPSCTEIVFALGLGDHLVGRSHECDFPPAVRRLPACTRANLNADTPSREIDRDIKALLQGALSIYSVDLNLLKALQPDFILTQSQCEVCAVSLPEVERAVSGWTAARPQIISLAPDCLGDIWNDITTVAEALDVKGRGVELVTRLQCRVEEITGRTKTFPRPSVVCVEWLDPLMAAGNWVPELVELAGGLNLFCESGKHSPWLNWEAVREHDSDILLIMPCGFDIARIRRELPALMQKADWEKLRAVRTGRVYLADGSQYFNRPGPRLVETLEILAEIIHPNLFHFGHEGKGWERL